MSEFKGKDRTDKHAIRLYDKDFNSFVKPYSKICALAAALKEAEEEIERLVNDAATSTETALHKHIVSQQRELLAFVKEVAEWDKPYSSTNLLIKAKKLLKANCC